MPATLHTSTGYSLPLRPYRSVLGSSKFMKPLPGAKSSRPASAFWPSTFWDPGFLSRLRVPLSRIHE